MWLWGVYDSGVHTISSLPLLAVVEAANAVMQLPQIAMYVFITTRP